MEHFGRLDFERKGDLSPVTVYDRKIDEEVRRRLAEDFPEMGYEGEETGDSRGSGGYWTVDPIDGTTSYIRRLTSCTSMAAYVDGEDILAAVIYDFVGDVLYTAIRGEGAYRDGEKIEIFESDRMFEVNMHGRKVFSEVSALLSPQDFRVHHPMGAMGRQALHIAEGKFDGYMNLDGRGAMHDFAPGILIAMEAGAVVVPILDEESSIYRWDRPFFIGSGKAAEIVRRNREEIGRIFVKNFGE